MATTFQKYPCKYDYVDGVTFASGTPMHNSPEKRKNDLIGSGTTTRGLNTPIKERSQSKTVVASSAT